jgi:hypothetical protein
MAVAAQPQPFVVSDILKHINSETHLNTLLPCDLDRLLDGAFYNALEIFA